MWGRRRWRGGGGEGRGSRATQVAPGAWVVASALAGKGRKQRRGGCVCVCVEVGGCWGQLLVPRLHHRTVIPFSAEQSRAGTVAASLFFIQFFVTILTACCPINAHRATWQQQCLGVFVYFSNSFFFFASLFATSRELTFCPVQIVGMCLAN